jgi:transcriptional regulator with XRE-family HTH domain
MLGGNKPYQYLGRELAKIRGRMQESLAEVSGAVEIDQDTLAAYEEGAQRPSEDILDLLISHFSIKEEESTKLWKLAGYEDQKNEAENEDLPVAAQPIMLLPFDARIIYTDTMNVVVDKHGVVINFLQGGGQNGQQLPAARVGMSLEYAKKVADTLQETIKKANQEQAQKNLPAPKKDDQI